MARIVDFTQRRLRREEQNRRVVCCSTCFTAGHRVRLGTYHVTTGEFTAHHPAAVGSSIPCHRCGTMAAVDGASLEAAMGRAARLGVADALFVSA